MRKTSLLWNKANLETFAAEGNIFIHPISINPRAGHPVVLLAATNRVEALDESLRRPGRLDKEIEVGVPNPIDRRDILRKLLSSMRHSLDDGQVCSVAFQLRFSMSVEGDCRW